MADLQDFLATHPVPQEAPRSAGPPRRNIARLEVSSEPCRYGRCPPEHNHPDIMDPRASGYWPEPDEFRAGWTSQNIPGRMDSHHVPQRCIMCWSLESNLAAHICRVVEALTG